MCYDWFSSSSNAIPIHHGVPQGSVLGPVMFITYMTPIADISKKHQVLYHRFTDDIQLYVSYNPAVSDELENVKQLLIQCIGEIRAWMLIHQLKLNNDKTEFIVRQPQLGTTWTYFIINRCSQESGLLLRPTSAVKPPHL